jgi:hypothetical protein
MISSASSFQRRQSRSVSITLAPTNPHRTFACIKFRRTSGELFRWNRTLPVQMDTTLEFPLSSFTPWWGRSRESDVDSVVSASSSPTPSTPLQLRWALPSPSFLCRWGWAHYCVHLVDLVPFCHSRARVEIVPIESLYFLRSLFCVQSPWPTRSVPVSCSAEPPPEPPQRSTAGRRRHGQVTRDAEPRAGSPSHGRRSTEASPVGEDRAAVRRRPAAVLATFDSSHLPPSAAGEHLPAIPLISSLCFVPHSDP